MIIDDADSPAVEDGVYVIGYGELVDGYCHAFHDSRKRSLGGQRVRYSRTLPHPPDRRCPECKIIKEDRERTDRRQGREDPPGLPVQG